MNEKDEQMAEHLSYLINKRQFRRALHELNDYHSSTTHDIDAEVYFQGALLELLLGRKPYFASLMRLSPGYNPVLEGDLLRDGALACIRQHRYRPAENLIAQAHELHQDDENRLAALTMVLGRLAFQQGDYQSAFDLHREADQRWRAIGDAADPQWVLNNEFHWIRAAVAGGQLVAETGFYVHFIANEPSRSRKVRAMLFCHLGKPGVRLDQLLERLSS